MSSDEKLELEPLAGFTPPGKERPRPGSARKGLAPRWVAALVLILITIALAESAATLFQHLAAPTEEDWRRAAAKAREVRRPGDPVLFAPLWVEPLGRMHLGAELPLELQLLSDVDRHARVIEVSARGARHPWLQGLRPRQSFELGALRVALYEKEPARVLADFTRDIARATVERVGDRLVQCPLQGDRFRCDPAQSWNWVGRHLAEVEHRPYRCIYTHPVDGHIMRITFPSARIGRTLVGYTGIDDFENRKRAQRPVQLQVRVGEQVVGTVKHLNKWPWHRFSFDTSTLDGRELPVRFEITTEGAYARTFCFAADTRR